MLARPFAITLTVALAACSGLFSQDAQVEYESAIYRSAVVTPETVHALQPLPAGESVIVVSWLTQQRLPCQGEQPECTFTVNKSPIWVTLDGEIKKKCSSWHLAGTALQRRLEQLLGLPPNSPPRFKKVAFVEMSVSRENIDRPCLGLDTTNPAEPKCTLRINSTQKPDVLNFVERQMADSYLIQDTGGPGYPFSRLGYTYDWNPGAAKVGHYGVSEFLVSPGATVVVRAQTLTDRYCGAEDQSAAQ